MALIGFPRSDFLCRCKFRSSYSSAAGAEKHAEGHTESQTKNQTETAEPTLPEVVIASGKRTQWLAAFNGAAAVVDEGTLRDAGAGSVLALDRVLPGLYTGYGANVMFPIITVRGITSAQDFYNPAVTVYVDGVPQLPVMAAQSLAGAERVELLKGPQGTLYDKNALGGVLNVQTRTPDDTPWFS